MIQVIKVRKMEMFFMVGLKVDGIQHLEELHKTPDGLLLLMD